MSVSVQTTAVVTSGVDSVSLSSLFSVTASASDPTYLVVDALDRNEYTAGANVQTGSFSGNGKTDSFGATDSVDGRGAGIVFTYQASTGRYYNATYGYFDQLSYNASTSAGDLTSLSVYTTNSLATATQDAASPYNMAGSGATYVGSTTLTTQPGFTGPTPTQATPNSICSVATTFVGKAWNDSGCWVLASTIAAEAGAGLPIDSTMIGTSGQSNGEWFLAFNGSATPNGNWQSLVKAGEIVVIGGADVAHITTCVAGQGSTAMLIDNMVSESSKGTILNPANDGSANDITILAAHAASQEWTGVLTADVKIYELDCPVVSTLVSVTGLSTGAKLTLSSLVSAADPEGKSVTEYQIYDSSTADSLQVGSAVDQAHTAAAAVTVASLSGVTLDAGSTATTDTLEVRAYNGSYWGDWQALTVSVTTAATKTAPPVVAIATANQTETANRAFTIALPSGSFLDPQGQALTYSATLSGGGALPSWLSFNAATDSFSGTAPVALGTIAVTVTATDTAKLSISETFNIAVTATAPTLASQTATQTWKTGQAVSFTLPANTFSDPQGETLSYSATLANGQALPSWLKFNAATDSFTGTAPASAGSLALSVTATDQSGLSVKDSFTANVVAPPVLTTQTANQTLTGGQAFTLALAANTFTDPNGQTLTLSATQANGQALPSWLKYNPQTDTFSGVAPTTASSTTITVTATDQSGLSVSESFLATVTAPVAAHTLTVANQTPTQTWLDGQVLNVTLPANTFADSTGQALTYSAYQIAGNSVTSWLHFNAQTDTFTGTVPTTASGTVGLEVIARDSSGLTATDVFNVNLSKSPSQLVALNH
jgi:hypothetical protein